VIQIVYRWKVPEENREAFLAAWSSTTQGIRETTEGARGSLCIVSVEDPTEILTIAKWDRIEQWLEFIKTAKSTSMSEMHTLGVQLSHAAYEQAGDHTI
jgi:heme-degrading monooxygenase HmoA